MTRTLAALLFAAIAPACTQAPDGSPDTGTGGKGDGDSCMPGASGTPDTCFGFAKRPVRSQTLYSAATVQTDDKIVVYGTGIEPSAGNGYRPFVQRFLASGAPDPA